ncbi:MAG: hypothetical protein QM534_14085 [Sediminibacterium sp.]|nr:hypothetical protein [Sediminibacterium sp.]
MEFSALDFDCFFIDKKFTVSHLASAGVRPFDSIIRNWESYDTIISYFKDLPIISHEVMVNCDLNKYVQLMEEQSLANYLGSFKYFAERGLYSFDKTILNDVMDTQFHLVAYPSVSIDFTAFPDIIKSVLLDSTFDGDVKEWINVDVKLIS